MLAFGSAPEPVAYPLYAPFQWNKAAARETIRIWAEAFGHPKREALVPGTSLFREGTPPKDVFLLVDGMVLLTCTSPSIDRECTLAVRFPGQLVEPCAHLLGVPYSVSAAVLTNSQIFRIPAVTVRKVGGENPQAAALFERSLAADLYDAFGFITQLKESAPADRLIRFVRLVGSFMGSESPSGKLRVSMPLRDHQIAEILGFSPRQFKRVKRQLQNQGSLQLLGARLWSLRHHS